jgi:hypothetical protein
MPAKKKSIQQDARLGEGYRVTEFWILIILYLMAAALSILLQNKTVPGGV